MTKPEGIPQWAWNRANGLVPGTVSTYSAEQRRNYQSMVARSLAQVRDQALEAAAIAAEEYGGFPEDTGSPPTDFSNEGRNEAATEIASAIRSRK